MVKLVFFFLDSVRSLVDFYCDVLLKVSFVMHTHLQVYGDRLRTGAVRGGVHFFCFSVNIRVTLERGKLQHIHVSYD